MEEVIIDSRSENQRLDKYLRRYLPNAAGGFLYRMLREKKIKVNGKKSEGSYILKDKDVVAIFFSEETLKKFKGVSGKEAPKSSNDPNTRAYVPGRNRTKDVGFGKNVVYEDDNVLIYNKPAGMLSQKAGLNDISACEYLVDYLYRTGQADDDSIRIFKPSAVNRLDRNTSGLLVCAKTLPAAQKLSEMFRDRSLDKHYLALVYGDISESRHIKAYLKKNPSANKSDISTEPKDGYDRIETLYKPLERNGKVTLLDVKLITGKSHQIRAHLSSAGYPLIGDVKYASAQSAAFNRSLKRQFLHAYKLTFPKCTGCLAGISEMTFTAELPGDLKQTLDALK